MKPIRHAAAALGLLAGLAGCELQMADASRKQPAADETGDAAYLSDTGVRDAADQPADSAVETALAWAKKYAEASAKLQQAQQDNRRLVQDNQQLQQQLADSRRDLQRAEKELGEANAMLMEMRDELQQWKKNVLGFRDEMRRAEQAELLALTRVLKLLGAEVADGSTAAVPHPSGAAHGVNAAEGANRVQNP
jgi:septal ring factor EnvC (AmiA/AmiB activator)